MKKVGILTQGILPLKLIREIYNKKEARLMSKLTYLVLSCRDLQHQLLKRFVQWRKLY